jgi:predicted dehydrogenase
MQDGIGRRQFLKAAPAAVLAAASARGQAGQEGTQARPLRLGLIGAGARGSFLAKTALEAGGVELAAVCDIYRPRLAAAAAAFNARPYTKVSDLVGDPGLDAVLIATPDRHHVPNAIEAIRAGKDVYVEKPVCHWAQFDKLKQFVAENRRLKRVVQVGTQYVCDPVWDAARDRIRAGALGKPVHAQTCYFRHGDEGERGMPIDDPNAAPGNGNVDWDTFQADAPRRPFSVSRLFQWRLYMDYSGGPLTDCYPHMLSPLLYMLDAGMPRKVVATGGRYWYRSEREVPDTFDLLIQYPQGLTVVVLGSFVNDTGIDPVVRGNEATLVRAEDGVQISPEAPGRQVEYLPATVPGGRTDHSQLTLAHLGEFFDCVRMRRTPRANLEFAYRVQVPLLMAMRSHLEEKVVFFDPAREAMRTG